MIIRTDNTLQRIQLFQKLKDKEAKDFRTEQDALATKSLYMDQCIFNNWGFNCFLIYLRVIGNDCFL